MLYYLALALKPSIHLFNAFTYHTVRAGGAAFTGFFISLILGPPLIRRLRVLKVGQHIRKEHVADLHVLHENKAGTPTMGGTLIILASVITVLLWARWDNRLLAVAVGVLCLLGAVGFLDDYIKLRRERNLGLSAKAKFAGQILVGLSLGLYLFKNPITVSATYLSRGDVVDWPGFVAALAWQNTSEAASPGHQIWRCLPAELRADLGTIDPNGPIDEEMQGRILNGLNGVLKRTDLYDATVWKDVVLNGEGAALVETGIANLSSREVVRLNRILLEGAFPKRIARSTRSLHTKVEIPGFRKALIPLGGFYVLFVLLIIVASSNAVNLTDGLDGLAIGASIMSLLAYTGITYVVSRADWSEYLFLIYVPEASELTVFGAALIGTGLGFLWFNSHPAELFMGDTGSLALGGAIGTMAILTKQELLLVVVGGLFVLEAASVIIQVVSFKLRGKRVFKMAPLHHHFELLGWSESKVTIRFWILALLFALLSMGALKLR